MTGQKTSVYLPMDLLRELEAEAARQERTLSWLLQQAWRRAKRELSRVPSAEELVARRQSR